MNSFMAGMLKVFLFLLLLDAILIAVFGGLWVFNIAWNELTGVDLAKRILEKLNDHDNEE